MNSYLVSLVVAASAAAVCLWGYMLYSRATKLARRFLDTISGMENSVKELSRTVRELEAGVRELKSYMDRNLLIDLVHLNRDHWHQPAADRICLPDAGFKMPGYYGAFHMWPEEFEMLSRYAAKARAGYLEIGTFTGLTAAYFARLYPELPITCVDAFQEGHATLAGVKAVCEKNLQMLEEGRIRLFEGYSRDVLPRLSTDYDLILIDADHSYESVLGDARLSLNILKPGGYLLFHDYSYVEETTRAVDDFVAGTDGVERVEKKSGLLAVRRMEKFDRGNIS